MPSRPRPGKTPPFLEALASFLGERYPDGPEPVYNLPGMERHGDPPEVVIERTGDEVRVSRFELVWDGPYTPVVSPVLLGVVRWPELAPDVALEICRRLVDEASRQRRESFRTCRYCHETLGPEHMHTDDVCQGCAERYLGVVH